MDYAALKKIEKTVFGSDNETVDLTESVVLNGDIFIPKGTRLEIIRKDKK